MRGPDMWVSTVITASAIYCKLYRVIKLKKMASVEIEPYNSEGKLTETTFGITNSFIRTSIEEHGAFGN